MTEIFYDPSNPPHSIMFLPIPEYIKIITDVEIMEVYIKTPIVNLGYSVNRKQSIYRFLATFYTHLDGKKRPIPELGSDTPPFYIKGSEWDFCFTDVENHEPLYESIDLPIDWFLKAAHIEKDYFFDEESLILHEMGSINFADTLFIKIGK